MTKIKDVANNLPLVEKFELFCPECRNNPEAGMKVFERTKGHPCSSCNRPSTCRTIIK